MDPDAVAELDATFVSAMRVSVAEGNQDPAEMMLRMNTQRLTPGWRTMLMSWHFYQT
ncbi:hypothetical protein PC129_g23832 [Phytophthora cactorum]|uniref:Uncharacterized protein n=1 Tax=Phytophthora cactorum TaxID=29920 RepID=A0A8T1LAH8_9STRA|nr:hypothetical protein Pcac1_g19638 [Phytophthora cactorum]KAG2792900.1 hypothetical protein PC112_g23669 [Phytophthora cactorum]KAG2957854.1 hypothetical protein PC118_g23817 [Phytophthora cactorum]KAG3129864.1 hypothetical protein C6341_g23976 [Phytophthora cactorum]KAG3200478.1 hypothetical protein PC129_g23832 [Phytophthora cactorum]